MEQNKWELFEVIGRPYALLIMGSLNESPKRYSDLTDACLVDKTRTKRLNELREVKLIETFVGNINKKLFVYYTLTKKGKKLFKVVSGFGD